jgi:hypothetical protein
MDIGPVERIRPIEPIRSSIGPSDVSPALGIEGPGQAEDDSYRDSSMDQKRGMEGENEDGEQKGEEATSNAPPRRKNGVNCFA